MSARNCVVIDSDGQIIATKLMRAQINRLRGYDSEGRAPHRDIMDQPVYNQVLVRVHGKRKRTYVALVAAAVIMAELRREFKDRSQTRTEASCTTRWEQFVGAHGIPVRNIQHKTRMIFRNYGPDVQNQANSGI